MIAAAFTYRARRVDIAVNALPGDKLYFLENIEYVIEFLVPPTSSNLNYIREIGYDSITPLTGILCFRNFVGIARFAGVELHVVSSKLGENGVSGLLEQISELSANLVFGWRTPTGHAVTISKEQKTPPAYHQLQFLRDVMLRRPSGQRLQDFIDIIERNPTRRFLLERPIVDIERVRNLDARSVNEIFTRPDKLIAIPKGSSLENNQLAIALKSHFPTRVSQPARRLTYDTPENRFIKYFIAECLAVVYRMLDNKNIHPQLKLDCREMATILESINRSQFMLEVGNLASFAVPTQALAKGEGYKDLLDLWQQFGAHWSLPSSESEVERLLQGRDIALLYEYWVFVKVLEGVNRNLSTTNDLAKLVSINRDDLGERLDRGITIDFNSTVSVSFNPSFKRSNNTAYSTPLRPDVVLSINNRLFAFDAKYRLQWKNDLNETVEDEATYLRDDLYKMHTYRDAITNMHAAFTVYPGTDFVFFERGGRQRLHPALIESYDGVGAIPARPNSNDPGASLNILIARLLSTLM